MSSMNKSLLILSVLLVFCTHFLTGEERNQPKIALSYSALSRSISPHLPFDDSGTSSSGSGWELEEDRVSEIAADLDMEIHLGKHYLLNHSLHLESSSGLIPYKLEKKNREMDPGVFLKFLFGDRGGSWFPSLSLQHSEKYATAVVTKNGILYDGSGSLSIGDTFPLSVTSDRYLALWRWDFEGIMYLRLGTGAVSVIQKGIEYEKVPAWWGGTTTGKYINREHTEWAWMFFYADFHREYSWENHFGLIYDCLIAASEIDAQVSMQACLTYTFPHIYLYGGPGFTYGGTGYHDDDVYREDRVVGFTTNYSWDLFFGGRFYF
jgi:hypothetical protein